MKILIDARTIRPGMTGVGRTTLGLLRALAGLAGLAGSEGLRVRAVVLPQCVAALRAAPELREVFFIASAPDHQSHPWAEWWLLRGARRLIEPGEIYDGPAFVIPPGAPGCPGVSWGHASGAGHPSSNSSFPRVVTIHDMGVFLRPKDYPPLFGLYLRAAIRSAVRSADAIVAPTEYAAGEIAERFPLAAERIRAIHWGAEAPVLEGLNGRDGRNGLDGFDGLDGLNERNARLGLAPEERPYFLCVGSLEIRKNPRVVAEALALITRAAAANPGGAGNAGNPGGRPRVIWVGGPGRGAAKLKRLISAVAPEGDFVLAGALGDRELDRLRDGAVALVHPAFYEGFGLPPLEAMAAGLPVIAADIPPLREICGQAALYFSPADAAALADHMRFFAAEFADDLAQAAAAGAPREARIRAGRRRAAEFTWAACALRRVELYRELAGLKILDPM